MQSCYRVPCHDRTSTLARGTPCGGAPHGKAVVKLKFGRRDDPVLSVLRDARAVARKEGISVRVRLTVPLEEASSDGC